MSYNTSMEAAQKEEMEGMMSDQTIIEWPAKEEPNWNTEEYNAIDENTFQSVAENPLSTFSADVDTASYSNVRRLLMDGGIVDPGAVRIEEMVNYFSYDYKEPEAGEPFGVTMEIGECPWNTDTKLLMLGLKTEDIDRSMAPHSNLVFLLDVSGSMYDEDKLPLVQKAFALLTENLTENDRISIVTYAGADRVVLEGVTGDKKEQIMDAVNSLEASGSTAGSAGIETAYQIAQKNFIANGNNRIILATDGDLNVGITSTSELTNLITQKKETGIYLSVLGFGTGNLKDDKMEALADKGNGNYAYIDSLNEARKVLVEEMGSTLITVAEDVKFQIEFNPNNIKGYRLIGYENRILESQDFDDDTKDAGEIGAGHTVTVLYEIVPCDSEIDLYTPDLKYQSKKSGGTVDNSRSISDTDQSDTLSAADVDSSARNISSSDKTVITMTPYSDEYATLSIRYKKPGELKSSLLTYEIKKSRETATSSASLRFAAAVAEFGMKLRNSRYTQNLTYSDIRAQLHPEDCNDTYKQEFLELLSRASSQYEDSIEK
ncbi:MAG: VWA domain-containing protein [Lachnospiraceae bacterium]|nr:VWA domain-containing protein [Lachnospiraceae bacterium]